jgi:hypothetical protein
VNKFNNKRKLMHRTDKVLLMRVGVGGASEKKILIKLEKMLRVRLYMGRPMPRPIPCGIPPACGIS